MCPSVWLSSYLLPLYKGKGPLSETDSYRDVALQCVVLKLHTYILNHRIGDWAETEGVIQDQQHGFRNNRSATTAIKLLNQYVAEALATPKTPLYVTYVDFKKAFDSVDRSLLLCNMLGHPVKLLELSGLLFVGHLSNCLSNSVTQNVILAQGKCMSPLLSIYIIQFLHADSISLTPPRARHPTPRKLLWRKLVTLTTAWSGWNFNVRCINVVFWRVFARDSAPGG